MELKPGYKLTEVGVIPEDWVVSYVGESFEVCNELRFPISQSVRERMSGPYPYYGPTNVQGWINEYRVEGKYALIGEDGDHFLKWRTQAMTLLVSGQFNVNNHAHLVCGRENLTEWFYWFFSNRDLIPYLTRQGASRYKLKKATLIKMPCALPPISEQRSIATALSDMDELLGGLDRLITKKRDLKQSAMQQLLTGKTRLPGFYEGEGYEQTEIGLIPDDWQISKVGEVCDFIVPGRNKPKLFDGDIPWITTPDLEEGKTVSFSRLGLCVSRQEARAVGSKIVPPGSVLMSCAGELGIVALTQNEIVVNQQLHVFIPTEQIDGKFLLNALAYQKGQIANYGTKTAVPYLNKTTCNSILIALPPLLEQKAIASILSDMDTEIATLEQRRNKTRDLKQAMMQELLTGRIRLL